MNILYVRANFPKHSETFILQEILALRRMGNHVQVLAFFCETHKIHEVVFDENVYSFVLYDSLPFKVPKKRKQAFKRLAPSKEYWSIKNFFKIHKTKKHEDEVNGLSFKAVRILATNPIAIIKLSRRMNNLHLAVDYFLNKKKSIIKPDIIYCPFSTLLNLRYAETISKHYGKVPIATCFRANDLYSMYQVEPQERVEMLKEVSTVVTISKNNTQEIKKRYSFVDNLHVVHSSIDTSFFTRKYKRTQNDSATSLILSVGRLIEKKGFFILLKACNLLKNKGLSFECIIAGEGPLELKIKAEIKTLGLEKHVKLVGSQNRLEIKDLLTKASLFTLPCVITKDGSRDILANAIKEAMAMELPVVTSDISGIEELVQHKRNGLLCKEHCHLSLSNALEELLLNTQLRVDLGARGRETVLANFSSDSEPAKLVNAFEFSLKK